ncbi:5-(carboxyamino)imidazole ribonucleotide mutase [Actinomyces sp. zg-332]|uniref:5-(carboxyamino)imidazole ribonucleotide mutase n=1 Tax=Actinomyces sp. zg-332 TaxID=2708340 RepID=UPI0014206C3A|nr:5-(carboxyamino)imidazole ribonucleotide mutase [Actinomyces sp. zg-332]QPK93753.1 5-(carboxyamino)imidazole ribonucleotide mutase [Actinomyces sp. zg-332]
MPARVGIVMGSDSDYRILEKTADVLREFDVEFEMIVASAHRTPEMALNYAQSAEEKGIQVLIAGAGAAAHLPGVIAAKTVLPVIGVPINATALNGIDALYAIVQMPSGVPVATVAVDGAKNAGLLAIQILATKDEKLREKLHHYKEKMVEEVSRKNAKLQELLLEN